jgi:hypothetical protein
MIVLLEIANGLVVRFQNFLFDVIKVPVGASGAGALTMQLGP